MTAEDVRAAAARFGISCVEAHRAFAVADARFGGDIQLGVAWQHANTLAVFIRGDRAAWNDNYARAAVAEGRFA